MEDQGAKPSVPNAAVAQQSPDINGGGSDQLMLELRKYLLLLAILAATVTYVAGLNPPGGVWLDTQGGHLTGNQILVVTYHARYNTFSYSNATAFMASAVVILLLLFGFKDKKKDAEQVQGAQHGSNNSRKLFVALPVVMVLDLLALVVAYAAGASRDTLTTVLAALLVSPIFIYVLLHVVMDSLLSRCLRNRFSGFHQHEQQPPAAAARGSQQEHKVDKRRRKIVMLLAIFATTITYTAGLNPPGGFWPDTQPHEGQEQHGGHRAGDPVLQHHHGRRFAVFFVCNTISFVASFAVIMLLLTKLSLPKWKVFQLLIKPLNKDYARDVPYAFIWVSLVGLVGAYAAGSCRETDSTAGVLVLYVVGPMLALLCIALVRWRGCSMPPTQKKVDGQQGTHGLINTAPFLVLLLATLAATVTYQAGLNPPGGFWPDNRDGHKGGDLILLNKHGVRYRLFFHFNSTALAASLVVIFMVLRNYLSIKKKERLRAHVVILEVVMILDLIALIGAFATGCCWDVSISIYVITLAGGALVYVVFHIAFFTLHRDDLHHKGDGSTEEKRKLLLMLAILAVTLTYQAGLTPPRGFWLGDDSKVGHHAGDLVLLSNYPRRYTAFFYLNATGFMASVALTILGFFYF